MPACQLAITGRNTEANCGITLFVDELSGMIFFMPGIEAVCYICHRIKQSKTV
jgi:hypothetical protein